MKKYIRKISFYLFSSFLFCLALPALADEGEVTLWGKAKAGMTPEEVMHIYPDNSKYLGENEEKSNGLIKLVSIPNIYILYDYFSVDFYFSKNRLARVSFSNYKNDEKNTSSEDLSNLIYSLKHKYGKEMHSQNNGSYGQYVWTSTDKNIVLEYQYFYIAFQKTFIKFKLSYQKKITYNTDNI